MFSYSRKFEAIPFFCRGRSVVQLRRGCVMPTRLSSRLLALFGTCSGRSSENKGFSATEKERGMDLVAEFRFFRLSPSVSPSRVKGSKFFA